MPPRTITSVILMLILVPAIASAEPKDRQVNGYASLVELKGGAKAKRYFSYRGRDQSYVAQSDGGQSITWKTAAVPADAIGGTVTFVFAATVSVGQRVTSRHEISLDGKKVLTFALPVDGDRPTS